MVLQRQALQAGTDAKRAAKLATQAPITTAGQAVVKKAQAKLAEARLKVEAAHHALITLKALKAKAAKAILDAAGGKYNKETGAAGQGGYFGQALKTAFHNGELTERLKHTGASGLHAAEKKAFHKGEAVGVKKGETIGEKAGAKKVFPAAVAKAERMLKEKKTEKSQAAAADAKEAKEASLQREATREASKVRESIETKAASTEGAAAAEIATGLPQQHQSVEAAKETLKESKEEESVADAAMKAFEADTSVPELALDEIHDDFANEEDEEDEEEEVGGW